MIENERKANQTFGKVLLTAGAITFGTTYAVSRIGNHSEIHRDIANIALGAEALTDGVGLGLILSDRTEGNSATLQRVGEAGLVATIFCHALVAITDEPFVRYLKSGQALTGEGVANLAREWLGEFKRYIRDDAKVIFESARKITN